MYQQDVRGLQLFNRNHGGHQVVLLCSFLPPWSLHSQTHKIKQNKNKNTLNKLNNCLQFNLLLDFSVSEDPQNYL